MPFKIKNKKEEDAPDNTMTKEEIQDLVYNMEAVKKAIETCIEYEKATGVPLINKSGRVAFSKEYIKEEKKNRVKEMIRDEVQQQITPLNIKLDKIIDVISQSNSPSNNDAPQSKNSHFPDRLGTNLNKIYEMTDNINPKP